MTETNGRAPAPAEGPEVDLRLVVESLGQQVATLVVELAVRDAAIAGIRAELEGLKAELAATTVKPAAKAAT